MRVSYAGLYDEKPDAIIGSRIFRLGSSIKRSYLRHVLGRLFATVTGFLLKLGTYDSQCGAKVFRKHVLETAFGEGFISRWIFDIEILIRLKGFKVIECPLTRWVDIKGSKVRMWREAITVLSEIIKIRNSYRNFIQ